MAEHHSSGNSANHGIYRQQVAPILAAAQQHLRRGGTTTGETHSQRGRPRGGPLASLSSSGSNSRRPSTAASNSSSAGTSSSSSGMMRFVEGFVSPFVQCWQPPLNACAGMELKLPNHNTGSRYACGGDIAGCADEVMPTVCGSGGGAAVATTRSNRGRSRMSFSSRSPVPVPVQTTSTMVTPTASSVAPPNHRPMYPRTTPPVVRHPPHVIQNLAPAPTNNNGSTAAQQHQPCATDVLCGRGGSSNRHNVHFRELVAANKAIYTTLTKKQKMLLSRKVVETIHQAGGRFLAKDATTGEWQDIGLPRSWEKASQALREKTSNASNINSNHMNNTNRKGNENIELMGGSEQGASDNVDSSSTQNKVHPRLAEAPPLTIPGHLQEIYRAKTFPTLTSSVVAKTPAVISSNTSSHPGWAAEFPPTDQSWVADFSPRPDPTESAYGYQQHHQPSEWAQSMPAPHRGAHPFSSRQMSRLGRKQSSNNSHKPSMVSPHNLSNLHTHSGTSWHQSPTPTYNTKNSAEAMMTTPRHHSQNHGDRHPASPDPGYTNHGGNNNRHSTLPVIQGASTIAVTPVRPKSTSDDNQQSDKRGGRSPEMKRQRTHEEGEETRDEEDVILFDDPHHHSGSEATFSLQNTSLTDGSHQLPAEVESKLSLQDKVISPSGLLQDRSSPRRPFAPSSPTITSTSTNNVSKRLNTSAEEEGLAGLVALSSATFLRMDES